MRPKSNNKRRIADKIQGQGKTCFEIKKYKQQEVNHRRRNNYYKSIELLGIRNCIRPLPFTSTDSEGH